MIGLLSTNANAKVAADIIKEFKFNPEEFPEVKERLMKATMRYYLGKFLYKKPENEEFMSLDRIEDLFFGFKPMLGYLVEDLVHKGKLNEAKGVCLRHGVHDFIRQETKETLNDVMYDQSKDPLPYDGFGPLSQPVDKYIMFPQHIKVEMVATLGDLVKLDVLLDEQYIGVDSEWRPSLSKFHKTYPSLFQISGARATFLIDFVSLRDSTELDRKLTEIFNNPRSVIVGFSFSSDIDQFARKFPQMKFYRKIKNFIDAQQYYSRVYLTGGQTGLAKVALKVLGKEICKIEQMSNWERRPLRQSQQHYAALDAYILVELI